MIASGAPRPCDLYSICCEVAGLHRGRGARTILCRAFGDARGVWDRAALTDAVSALTASAVASAPPHTPVTLRVTGLGAHVRLDVHRLGQAGARPRNGDLRAALAGVRALGGSVSITAPREGTTTCTVRLPRTPQWLVSDGVAPRAYVDEQHGNQAHHPRRQQRRRRRRRIRSSAGAHERRARRAARRRRRLPRLPAVAAGDADRVRRGRAARAAAARRRAAG
jgi:hypothetical protein